MTTLLSFDQAPPLAAPLRFFLTAPLFAAAAGLLLFLAGPELLASRWTPESLAFTHLITAGFMLQAMIGALLQILPVATGAGVDRPLWVARMVHLLFLAGGILLVAGFLSFGSDAYFRGALALVGAGLLVFVLAVGQALGQIPNNSPIQLAVKLAVAGLVVTLVLGLALLASLIWGLPWPLLKIIDIHVVWGWVGWGLLLLAGVAYVVVPMFLLTPPFSPRFSRNFGPALFFLLLAWSAAETWSWPGAALLAALVAGACAAFALVTLWLMLRSKRARLDATQRYWRLGLSSALCALALWAASQVVPALQLWSGLPLLLGGLVLVGGFMSVITGMLYKIVPFLVWLHLQNAGKGQVMAPNMKKVLSDKAAARQMVSHVLALALLIAAVFLPSWFARPAGAALFVSSLWLGANLLSALGVYRRHLTVLRSQMVA